MKNKEFLYTSKNKLLFTFIIVLMYSCGNNKSDEPVAEEDTSESVFSWQASINDSTGGLEIKKSEEIIPDSLNQQSIINNLNARYNNIHLELKRSSNDTVYLKIDDATFLTQQMGSAGATMYIAEVVYNITSIPGINYVNIDFKEGDHAQPGTYTRESFKNN